MSIEYSANLENQIDFADFCRVVSSAILSTSLFEVGAVRVRAFRAEAFAIADRVPENGFIDMNLRIGRGRSDDEKKRAGHTIFAAASTYLAAQFATPHFALSFEIRDIDPELSWKKNAIHPRLRSEQKDRT